MAELNLMVSDTQVERKQAQMNTLVLDIHHENFLDYVHEYFYAINVALPGYCCDPSITLLDSNQIFHISILDWNYSNKIIQSNKNAQEGRKKWTSLFEPHEHRASRDLHPVYDWWLDTSLKRTSVLDRKLNKTFSGSPSDMNLGAGARWC